MEQEKANTQQRLAEWVARLEGYSLPDWENLPQLELYMDQVVILLKQYLGPLYRGGEEKAITASTINNYVRMKVMPAPQKKRYTRVHLACLVMICLLKQSLSISCIQRMLPQNHSEEAVRQLYDSFVREYREVSTAFLRQCQAGGSFLSPENAVTSVGVLSTLAKGLAEYLLQEESEEDA